MRVLLDGQALFLDQPGRFAGSEAGAGARRAPARRRLAARLIEGESGVAWTLLLSPEDAARMERLIAQVGAQPTAPAGAGPASLGAVARALWAAEGRVRAEPSLGPLAPDAGAGAALAADLAFAEAVEALAEADPRETLYWSLAPLERGARRPTGLARPRMLATLEESGPELGALAALRGAAGAAARRRGGSLLIRHARMRAAADGYAYASQTAAAEARGAGAGLLAGGDAAPFFSAPPLGATRSARRLTGAAAYALVFADGADPSLWPARRAFLAAAAEAAALALAVVEPDGRLSEPGRSADPAAAPISPAERAMLTREATVLVFASEDAAAVLDARAAPLTPGVMIAALDTDLHHEVFAPSSPEAEAALFFSMAPSADPEAAGGAFGMALRSALTQGGQSSAGPAAPPLAEAPDAAEAYAALIHAIVSGPAAPGRRLRTALLTPSPSAPGRAAEAAPGLATAAAALSDVTVFAPFEVGGSAAAPAELTLPGASGVAVRPLSEFIAGSPAAVGADIVVALLGGDAPEADAAVFAAAYMAPGAGRRLHLVLLGPGAHRAARAGYLSGEAAPVYLHALEHRHSRFVIERRRAGGFGAVPAADDALLGALGHRPRRIWTASRAAEAAVAAGRNRCDPGAAPPPDGAGRRASPIEPGPYPFSLGAVSAAAPDPKAPFRLAVAAENAPRAAAVIAVLAEAGWPLRLLRLERPGSPSAPEEEAARMERVPVPAGWAQDPGFLAQISECDLVLCVAAEGRGGGGALWPDWTQRLALAAGAPLIVFGPARALRPYAPFAMTAPWPARGDEDTVGGHPAEGADPGDDPIGDVRTAAEAVSALLADPRQRRAIAEAAREAARVFHGPERLMGRLFGAG